MAAAARKKGQDQEGGMPGSTFMSWPAEATEVRPRISPEAPSDQGGWEARPGGESVHRPPSSSFAYQANGRTNGQLRYQASSVRVPSTAPSGQSKRGPL
ncbi:hypothetical protein CFAM422_004009 [Trichoderma lentiforme]|uniref:Uncharacterized protein n=1 Tax=Trichoderma lentiforme TaxID=1567552 RepID=A0A9P4XJR8_9HYPO|nr:hypothetical protein CFAM422_004009 [Trichoderma lentiforme]